MKVKYALEQLKKYCPSALLLSHDHKGASIISAAYNEENPMIIWIEDVDDNNEWVEMGCRQFSVQTLISVLEKKNPEAELRLHSENGEAVLFIVSMTDDESIVWLETESDNDMHSEIEARFAYAYNEQVDELDFYMEMLDVGINVEMVRKYMDNERADHMKAFCEEHGLL